MALNQYDRISILESSVMQSRLTSACVQYASYLLGGEPKVEQAAWAKGCLDSPSSMGRRVGYYIMTQPTFLGQGQADIKGDTWVGGSSISDVDLQGAVEAAINTHFIVAAE